ncbi:hypothetical protein HK102_012261, partial [Quaeritorhiza haematococci]
MHRSILLEELCPLSGLDDAMDAEVMLAKLIEAKQLRATLNEMEKGCQCKPDPEACISSSHGSGFFSRGGYQVPVPSGSDSCLAKLNVSRHAIQIETPTPGAAAIAQAEHDPQTGRFTGRATTAHAYYEADRRLLGELLGHVQKTPPVAVPTSTKYREEEQSPKLQIPSDPETTARVKALERELSTLKLDQEEVFAEVTSLKLMNQVLVRQLSEMTRAKDQALLQASEMGKKVEEAQEAVQLQERTQSQILTIMKIVATNNKLTNITDRSRNQLSFGCVNNTKENGVSVLQQDLEAQQDEISNLRRMLDEKDLELVSATARADHRLKTKIPNPLSEIPPENVPTPSILEEKVNNMNKDLRGLRSRVEEEEGATRQRTHAMAHELESLKRRLEKLEKITKIDDHKKEQEYIRRLNKLQQRLSVLETEKIAVAIAKDVLVKRTRRLHAKANILTYVLAEAGSQRDRLTQEVGVFKEMEKVREEEAVKGSGDVNQRSQIHQLSSKPLKKNPDVGSASPTTKKVSASAPNYDVEHAVAVGQSSNETTTTQQIASPHPQKMIGPVSTENVLSRRLSGSVSNQKEEQGSEDSHIALTAAQAHTSNQPTHSATLNPPLAWEAHADLQNERVSRDNARPYAWEVYEAEKKKLENKRQWMPETSAPKSSALPAKRPMAWEAQQVRNKSAHIAAPGEDRSQSSSISPSPNGLKQAGACDTKQSQ